MNVAVMQPYLFPYLGYYQLVQCADIFVLYDDVAFIKQGYINRNNILTDGRASRITVPVLGGSSNKCIKELAFESNVAKVLKTVRQSYAQAPFVDNIFPMIERVLEHAERDITTVCQLGIFEVFQHLGLGKQIIRSSDLDYDRELPAADRLIAICEKLGSSHYVNSIGGEKLYSKDYFAERGNQLTFLHTQDVEYPQQGKKEFVPNLSMIDVLMWCDKRQIRELLQRYTLV